MKVLVVSAHPDDEVLGVGGTICKHVENKDEVYICIATRAYEPEWTKDYIDSRKREQEEIDRLLNIKKRYYLDFETARLNTLPHGVFNKRVSMVVDELKPDIVYTHYEHDLHYDHNLLFKACLVATRPPGRIRLLCYETLSETEWNNKAFQPNLWIDISNYIEKKIEAFKIYGSEVKTFPHPRSVEGIIALSRKRGSEACIEYAESFMCIRDFWL